jgi:hypothetical protein
MGFFDWLWLAPIAVVILAAATLMAVPRWRRDANHLFRDHPWPFATVFGLGIAAPYCAHHHYLQGFSLGSLWFFGWGWLRPRIHGEGSWRPTGRVSRPET